MSVVIFNNREEAKCHSPIIQVVNVEMVRERLQVGQDHAAPRAVALDAFIFVGNTILMHHTQSLQAL